VELLANMLRDSPKLPEALCVNRSVLFDAEQDDYDERAYAIARAKGLCARCERLQHCREWAATQDRLSGVVAGEVRHFHDRKQTA
jgi:hypothetical protein